MAKRTAGAHGRARPVGGADCARPEGHDVELGGKEHGFLLDFDGFLEYQIYHKPSIQGRPYETIIFEHLDFSDGPHHVL